jgi:CxxC motif-containing protein
MLREFTCICCPNGCTMEAVVEDGVLTKIAGNLCKRGRTYVEQELIAPTRTISTSVRVDDGELPLVSVRLTAPIPRERIFDAMAEIRKQRLTAPVVTGQVIIKDVLGMQSDVIATKTVRKAEP